MEFIVRKDICKDFLDKYNKNIYPELLSRIIEIGILTLKLSFNKLTFTPNELDDIIESLSEQSKIENLKRFKNLKKLTNKKFKIEDGKEKIRKENNSFGYNTISSDDKIFYKMFINNRNFYDSNYFIPESKYFRNKQLYNKRLQNPLFTTQNKNVYPFWWWNFPESDYEMNNTYNYSDIISKSQSKSFNNQSISKNSDYDETKIFQRSSYNNEILYNNNEKQRVNDNRYYNKGNHNNYKLSYDRNLNIIGVEQSVIKSKKNK